jgi:hypothetical protein
MYTGILMQPVKKLTKILAMLAGPEHYLFSLNDLRPVFPDKSYSAFKAVVGRAEKNGLLRRVCRGIYLYPETDYPAGLVLYHTAARQRASDFNYLSLESVLSDAGVISQVPMNWITLMSSGRSSIVDCGSFGHIEFVHTKKKPDNIAAQLVYDHKLRLWRADVGLAARDMIQTRRQTDLMDWESVHETV